MYNQSICANCFRSKHCELSLALLGMPALLCWWFSSVLVYFWWIVHIFLTVQGCRLLHSSSLYFLGFVICAVRRKRKKPLLFLFSNKRAKKKETCLLQSGHQWACFSLMCVVFSLSGRIHYPDLPGAWARFLVRLMPRRVSLQGTANTLRWHVSPLSAYNVLVELRA